MNVPPARPYVHLNVFDGPLDLLLYLVHSEELDPRTIRVADIADQYMEFLQASETPELSIAGEYLVMAAKLLALKARELLPREEQGELETEEFEFDREELVRQLMEYRRFKMAAGEMRKLEIGNAASLRRGFDETRPPRDEAPPEDVVGIWDLLAAFREALKLKPHVPGHVIEVDDVPIEERMAQVRAVMVRKGRVLFDELYSEDNRRIVIVVSFMSLLELVKTEEVVFRQERDKGAIVLYRRNDTRFEEELASAASVISPDPDTNPDITRLLAEREEMRLRSLAREEEEWGQLSKIVASLAAGEAPDLPPEEEEEPAPDPVLATTPLGGAEEEENVPPAAAETAATDETAATVIQAPDAESPGQENQAAG